MKNISLFGIFIFVISGCASLPDMASVPMESAQITKVAKQFDPPSDGMAGLYIYRNTSFGGASYINVWVDSNCIGTTAPYVFFYEEVEGGISYKVSSSYTWAEAPKNDALIKVKSGMNYFFQQNINLASTDIEVVDEEQGKKEVRKLDMATKYTCRGSSQDDLYDRTYDFGKTLWNACRLLGC
jgi:hypothetical protein